MSWLYDNIKLITFLAIITIILIVIFGIIATSTSKTPEASDLQGFPETLGDFPPLELIKGEQDESGKFIR